MASTLTGGILGNGTNDWRGGVALVGDRGPELVNLPPHAQVIPNHMIGKAGTGGAGGVVMHNNFYGTNVDPNVVAEHLGWKARTF